MQILNTIHQQQNAITKIQQFNNKIQQQNQNKIQQQQAIVIRKQNATVTTKWNISNKNATATKYIYNKMQQQKSISNHKNMFFNTHKNKNKKRKKNYLTVSKGKNTK